MDYEKIGLLHDIFERQAHATPDKIAVVEDGGRKITFKELNEYTDILAEILRQKGLETDGCVGIYMEKCIEYVISYIAALKAGGAYFPIDVSYPTQLLKSVLEDAEPVAVITKDDLVDNLKDGISGLSLESISEGSYKEKAIKLKDGFFEEYKRKHQKTEQLLAKEQSLDDLAYVVFSSGTTGKPKGIMCPHRGSVFSYTWRHNAYPYQEGDREACNVFFTWEMLRPLLKGVTMYIIPDNAIYDPVLLCEFLEKHEITRMLYTPSLLETVINTSGINFAVSLKKLRQIFFCGEVVTTTLLAKCVKVLPWVHLLNLYSISECHDVSCDDLSEYYKQNKNDLTSRNFCPAGFLLPGVQVVILNEDFVPQPVGVPGEIFVGGPALARGYLKRPDLNKLRFIDRPENVSDQCGKKLYRTGDWGYMLSDSRLEICGRCDSMVKIRGYSIELQAVEAALISLPMVHNCVVLVKGEEGEDKFLVAYVVPEGQATKKEIRAELKRMLPFYMVPSFYIFLESIPLLTATGKLNKKALPEFNRTSNDIGADGKPATKTEEKVSDIWKSVLGFENIDTQESFFDMGGHSLLAAELLNRIKEKFNLRIPVKDLFSYPTISSLSALIDVELKQTDSKGRQLEEKKIDLLKEVETHDLSAIKGDGDKKPSIDMQLRAFWRTVNYGDRFNKGRVLLTGATGFLGAFILRELLVKTKNHVYCLVRELPEEAVMDRIKHNLQKYGLLAEEKQKLTDDQCRLEKMLESRVTAIKGNVSLLRLGLDEEEYSYLSMEIDFVIHAAAYVNLVFPYSALHGANVLGTENVILFAKSGKIKPLHYISTDSVFPHGKQKCSEDDDAVNYHSLLNDGYAQSKWTAEQLVCRAGKRGIPVIIYRLGNMAGDRKNGYWNPQDFTFLTLQACANLGIAPDVDWNMEMTPVDFAAELIVKLSQEVLLNQGKVFHIVNENPPKARWVFEWMSAHGFPVKMMPFDEWRHRITNNYEEGTVLNKDIGLLVRLLDSYMKDTDFFSKLSTYRADNMLSAAEKFGSVYPYVDSKILLSYFSQMVSRGIIHRKKHVSFADSNVLHDKVAIVTGASSGIGCGIAKTLAMAGAKVALAARRIDKMNEIKEDIQKSGGVCTSFKADVTNKEQVDDLVKYTEATLGPVDILINNAGVMYYTMMKNLHFDEWDRQIDVNIKGATICIGAVLDGMLKRKKGHIVNMSSDAGRKGFPGLAVYSGTKFYIEGLSQALRKEVCGSGVRVTCIQPGDVKSEILSSTTDTEAKETYDFSSTAKILEPEDIGKAVLYCVSQPEYVAINELLIEPRELPA